MTAAAARWTPPTPAPASALVSRWAATPGSSRLLGLLIVLFLFTKFIQPSYGVAGVQGLAISILPLAFAAVAQAIVVISRRHRPVGRFDDGARERRLRDLMKGQSDEFAIVVVVGVLLLGLALGAINGVLVVITKVPDIVVTLAMSFVWAGSALLVLNAPGGGAAQWLKDHLGPLGNEWIPKAAVVMLVVVAVVWLPLRRSKLGLSLYAVGSNRLAAFRSGVAVGRTKISPTP